MADIRPILSWLATANDADIAAVMKMVTEPKPTIVIGNNTFTLVPGVGYILSRESGCKIVVKDGRIVCISGIGIQNCAKLEEVSPTGLVLRGVDSSVHVTLVPHGEHRRICRVEILPHTPFAGQPAPLSGHNIVLFDEAGRHVSWEYRGDRETCIHHYVNGNPGDLDTIRGTRIKRQNYRTGVVTKMRRLHPDIIYSAGVFTVTTPSGTVDVKVSARYNGEGEALVIKGLVYKFWIGGVCRRFRAVGEGTEFTLEEIA